MQYKDFLENLAEDLREEFLKREENINVRIVEMKKSYGTEMGLQISDGRNICPVFYPEDFYENFERGVPYFMLFNNFIRIIEDELGRLPQELHLNLRDMLDTISIQLISSERGKEYIQGKVCRQIEDLSLIYRINLDFQGESGSIAITENMLPMLGINEEELYELAMEKAPVNFPCTIESMSSMLEKAELEFEESIPDSPFFIVTSERGCYGAGTIMYPGILERCAEIMNGDFYIIPSSVHECLLHPDNIFADLMMLKEIVKEVNNTQLSPEELLSYNVYHYDHKEKIFELAEKYESRMHEKDIQSLRERLGIKRREVVKEGHLRRNQDVGTRRTQEVSL